MPVLLLSFNKSLSCCSYFLPTSLFQRYHTSALNWCLSVTKTAGVSKGKFAKRRYNVTMDKIRTTLTLEEITLTGFQRKFKTLTSSSPSGNVASLRSLLGNRCITFPFTSSTIQQRKAGLIRNSEISRGV